MLISSFLSGVAVKRVLLSRPPRRALRENFLGRRIPVAGGAVLATALLSAELVALALVALSHSGGWSGPEGLWGGASKVLSAEHVATVLLILGFIVLGWVDDVYGDSGVKGFGGHLTALRSGVVTTGSVKAFGGAALAFGVAWWWSRPVQGGRSEPAQLLAVTTDALLVALAANLLNLLDLRPGRALKVFFLGWIALAPFAWRTAAWAASAGVAGGAAAWLPADLRERGMLGDSGAAALGAALGALAALSVGPTGKALILVGLAAATVASERWSFTKAIERVAPLRWLDLLGRLPPPKNR